MCLLKKQILTVSGLIRCKTSRELKGLIRGEREDWGQWGGGGNNAEMVTGGFQGGEKSTEENGDLRQRDRTDKDPQRKKKVASGLFGMRTKQIWELKQKSEE